MCINQKIFLGRGMPNDRLIIFHEAEIVERLLMVSTLAVIQNKQKSAIVYSWLFTNFKGQIKMKGKVRKLKVQVTCSNIGLFSQITFRQL
jgi:hypothetical protein